MGASCAKGSKTTDPDKTPYLPSDKKKKKEKGDKEDAKTGEEEKLTPGGEDVQRKPTHGSNGEKEEEERNRQRETSESSKRRRISDEANQARSSSSRVSSTEDAPSRPDRRKRDSRERPDDFIQDAGTTEVEPRQKRSSLKEAKEVVPQPALREQDSSAEETRRRSSEKMALAAQEERARRQKELRGNERKRSSLDNEFLVPVQADVTTEEPSSKTQKRNRDGGDAQEKPKKSGEDSAADRHSRQREDVKRRSDGVRSSDVELAVEEPGKKPGKKKSSESGAEKDANTEQRNLLHIEASVPRGVETINAETEIRVNRTERGRIITTEVASGDSSRPRQEEVQTKDGVLTNKDSVTPKARLYKTRESEYEIPPSGLTPISPKTRASNDVNVASHHAVMTSRTSSRQSEEKRKSGSGQAASPTKSDFAKGEETMAIFDALKGLKLEKSISDEKQKAAAEAEASVPGRTASSASPDQTATPAAAAMEHHSSSDKRTPSGASASTSSTHLGTTADGSDHSTSRSPPPSAAVQDSQRPIPAVRTTMLQNKNAPSDRSPGHEAGKISVNGIDSQPGGNEGDYKTKPERSSKLPVKGTISSPGTSPPVPTSGSISLSPVSPSSSASFERKDSAAPVGSPASIAETKTLLLDLSEETKNLSEVHQLCANTRTKLLQAIDRWLSGNDQERENQSRVLVISGRPGIGKTCLAVEVCRRYSSQLAGDHFFQFQPRRLDQNFAKTMLLSIARKLTEVVPGYAGFLPPFPELRQLLDDGELSSLFDALISRPLLNQRSDQHMVIVVDAVDECYPSDMGSLLQFINGFEKSSPDWLYFLCTLRNDNRLTEALDRVQVIELKGTSEVMTADVKRYLRDPMTPLIDRISLDGALTQLAIHAQGTFLAAYLLKRKLESFPEGTALALRDVTLFPTGFGEICRELCQRFYDHLSKKYSAKESLGVYAGVMGILALAKEKLDRAFIKQVHAGLDTEEDLVPLLGLLDADGAGAVGLHHRSISEWLLQSEEAGGLAVNATSARQRIADAVLVWLSPILDETTSSSSSSSNKAATVPAQLHRYALKHALEHLTDVAKQQDHVAGLLCNLRYLEQKLKVPGVTVYDLRSDYSHSHYQVTGTTSKLITLDGYMKKFTHLAEQIEAYYAFIQRHDEELSRHPGFLLHFAASDPTVARIQQNAQNDLVEKPWLEDVTAAAQTPSLLRRVAGHVCRGVLSHDGRAVAVLTSDEQNVFLYLLNLASGELNGDPIDVGSIADRKGLCVQFLPDNNHLFVGSLSTFIAVKNGKPVPSGLDGQSVRIKDRFSIECCDAAGGFLACGLNTLQWGGRSLYMVVFDLKSKGAKTLEILQFRFGGSAQFGIKACALSPDGSLLCACSKQVNKAEVKATVWSTGSWNVLHSVDVENDALTSCQFVGSSSVVLCGGTGTPESLQLTYLWSFQDKKVRVLPGDNRGISSVAYSKNSLLTLVHRYHQSSTKATVSRWRKEAGKLDAPDDRYTIHGLGELSDMVATEKSLIFFAKKSIRMFKFADLTSTGVHPTSGGGGGAFVLDDSIVESSCFIPRSDDAVVAYRSDCHSSDGVDDPVKIAVSKVTVKADGTLHGSELFAGEQVELHDGRKEKFRCFHGEGSAAGVVWCTADGGMVVINTGSSVKVLDIASGARRSLPGFGELKTEPSKVKAPLEGSFISCVLSSKELLAGVTYPEKPESLFLFDLKPSKTVEPTVELKLDAGPASSASAMPITDFAFIPTNGHVITYHRTPEQSLVVWNQRNGTQVSRQVGIDVVYVRQSPSSDRLALGVRNDARHGSLVLMNSDNRFHISLVPPTDTQWSPDVGCGDVEFSGDGTVLVGFFPDVRSVRIWNIGNGEPLKDLSFSFLGATTELVGMLSNTHAVLHDGAMLFVFDVDSGATVAAVHAADQLATKTDRRGLRISPRGGLIVGSTERGTELKVFLCHGLSSVKRKTTLQLFRTK